MATRIEWHAAVRADRSARSGELQGVLGKLERRGDAERDAQYIGTLGRIVDWWWGGGILNAHVVAEFEDKAREYRIPGKSDSADTELSGERFGKRWQFAWQRKRGAGELHAATLAQVLQHLNDPAGEHRNLALLNDHRCGDAAADGLQMKDALAGLANSASDELVGWIEADDPPRH
jgi:hypothetical protein